MQATLVLATLYLLGAHVTHVAASGSNPAARDQSGKGRPAENYPSRSLLAAPRYPAQQPGLFPEGMLASDADAQGHVLYATDMLNPKPQLTQSGWVPIPGSGIQSQAVLQTSTTTGASCLAPSLALLVRM